MGENERRRENPGSGLLPNGLLPNEAASVIQPLDVERWSKAEARIGELIRIIKPNKPSEDRREAVANYVQRLIMQCFPCEVFTFGSVPLKTYLPDGDIDVTAFSNNQTLKETWAYKVRDILESEEKNENADFHVKEVQYIQAEVKIIKCLVENIVVDISFNQLGGLCTLCFLEEVDNLISQDHLFKRSIILIKAWCYYESRILGAHHGLISTYALETLVLYIFHVFNNSFLGPLEVLYRFLEFFSKFDWDNFCVSLWGPVPISSLPDVTAEPPRQDGGDLLLSKLFLEACSAVYAVYPAGQENQGQPFVSKHFNVIDPLRVNNNLGRSVSKGNFFRIRSAFTFGAKRLARLLNCTQEDICFEVNQFFMNTWARHGSGQRPDVPRNDLPSMRLSNADWSEKSHTSREHQADLAHASRAVPSQHTNYPVESTTRSGEVSSLSRLQNKKYDVNSNNTITHDQTRREIGSNHGVNMEKSEKSSKPDVLAADQGKHFFVRTHSSPELTDSYASLQGRRDRSSERGKNHKSSARLDVNHKKNLESDNLASHSSRSSMDDPSSVRHTPSRQCFDDVADSDGVANIYHDDLGVGANGEQLAYPLGSHGMHHEEQDLVNMMAASTGVGYSGQVQVPFNLVPGDMPRPFSPSVLASMGYLPRNLGGMVPANIPLLESPWGTNMQFPNGLVSPHLVHYFPAAELSSNPDDGVEPGNENFSPAGTSPEEDDNDYLREHIIGSDRDNGVLEMHHSDNSQPSASTSYNYVRSSLSHGSATSSRVQQRSTKADIGSIREDHISSFPFQEENDSDLFVDDRAANERAFSTVHSTSLRSTSPESSLEETSWRVSKLAREKRGRKTSAAALLPTVYGRSKSVSQQYSNEIDDDNKHRNPLPDVGHQMIESGTGLVGRRDEPGIEPAQKSGSESLMPIAPMFVGPVSRQGATDSSGAVPFAFYATGPPIPFVTMLPLSMYNFPTETGTSDPSANQLYREDGLDSVDSVQNFDSSEDLDPSEILSSSQSIGNAVSAEPMEQKIDILNSDFASHWQNLQIGRLCQNSTSPAPMIYQSPAMVPSVYLPGCFPMEAPGRLSSANLNLVTQLSYRPRVLPVTPLQSVDMPRFRGGTGTYLPMPRASVQGRHVNSRKGSYAMNEKSDHRSDREGNWNGSKYNRGTRRSNNRSQPERSNLRVDRLGASENWADRPWRSHKQDMLPEYQSQNGPIRLSSSQNGSPSVAYGMHPVTSMTPVGGSSNGPPVVMFYPYNHNTGYASHPEQLEFGSLGAGRLSGSNEVLHLREGNRPGGGFEGHRLHGSSGRRSSPDQPSSPNFER